ncbi:MAG: methyltransferase [Woeseiaceae bacterium]|nr:methyltransferase [Woeseiaceae bacterium]
MAGMIQLPDSSAIREFRAFLDANEYDTVHLTERLGRARPPTPGETGQMFDDSKVITTANVLIRLFLLGSTIDQATAREFLPKPVVNFCARSGLLEIVDGIVRASVVIVPIDDLLFVSDAFRILGTREAAGFVLPASTHSANFLRLLTMRTPVDSALDLGCGCGMHALFAARHSKKVIATDISEAAIRYTRFNAMLNDMNNIECRQGSMFEPVEDLRFNLIVSNPPFVIGPGETFVYRDSNLELDGFCKLLVQQAPAYLAENGHLQMLCEWVEQEGQSWEERLNDWVRGCDAWILHSSPVTPADYVEQRSSDISGDDVNTGSADDWTAYFHVNNVRAVHPGMITLRCREGLNWTHLQPLLGDVETPAGQAIMDGIAAIDFLEACDDEAILEAVLCVADGLEAEQIQADGKAVGVYLRLNNGLSVEAEIDGPVAAFLNLFDRKRTVQECIEKFGALTDADPDRLTSDLLAILKVFVSRGFLLPADVE